MVFFTTGKQKNLFLENKIFEYSKYFCLNILPGVPREKDLILIINFEFGVVFLLVTQDEFCWPQIACITLTTAGFAM